MDLDQFTIMFRALYLEGFARPLEGVRVMMRVLLEKYREAGGERRMKCGVRRIVARGAGRRRSSSTPARRSPPTRSSRRSAPRRPAPSWREPRGPRARSATSRPSRCWTASPRRSAGATTRSSSSTTPSGSATATRRTRSTPGAGSSASRTTSNTARAGSSRRGSSGSPASPATTAGPAFPRSGTGSTRRAGSGRSRSRPSGSSRRSPGDALERATVARDMFTPTTVERVHRAFPGGDLRGAREGQGRAHRALQPLPVRHGPGDARDRGLDAERYLHGQPTRSEGPGRGLGAPKPVADRPGAAPPLNLHGL